MLSSKFKKVVSLAKRRGFVYPSSELYGGLSGFWDFGPLGVELKNNVKREWWRAIVWEKESVVGLDSTIIHNPEVWEASGHTKHFADPLIECKVCHKRYREDFIEELKDKVHKKTRSPSPSIALSDFETSALVCVTTHKKFTEPKMFNLMFKTYVGPVEDEASLAYLRPETAQGIFINFENIVKTNRLKLPFGIAQIGKAFRNEITTGNFVFRSREFEQAELEWFCNPKDADKWFKKWQKERIDWYLSLGMKRKSLRFHEHKDKERAHYAVTTFDIEYHFPWGWGELEGIANRSDYDLKAHNIKYRDEETGKDIVPYVIEPSMGIERPVFAFLLDAYEEDKGRVVLKLHPKLAPYKVAVFPLVANKSNLVKKAREVYKTLQGSFPLVWDDRGNIGKRYFSQDEIGTPWCVTIDYQTLKDKTVTVRARDSMKQERVAIKDISSYFSEKLS